MFLLFVCSPTIAYSGNRIVSNVLLPAWSVWICVSCRCLRKITRGERLCFPVLRILLNPCTLLDFLDLFLQQAAASNSQNEQLPQQFLSIIAKCSWLRLLLTNQYQKRTPPATSPSLVQQWLSCHLWAVSLPVLTLTKISALRGEALSHKLYSTQGVLTS